MPRIVGDSDGYSFYLKQYNGRYNQDAKITLPSVTTIIKRTLAAPALLDWYYRQTIDSIAGLVSQSSGFDPENVLSLGEICGDSMLLDEWLKENRMRPQDIGREAMDRGSNEHATLENLAKVYLTKSQGAAHELAERLFSNKKASGWQQGIASWWLETEPHIVASEQVIYSLTPPYAGTLDLVFDWVGSSSTGGTFRRLMDLKTRGEGGRAYISDHIQVAAYERAYTEMTGQHIDGRYILIVRADGSWDLEESTVPFSAFENLCSLYETLRRA